MLEIELSKLRLNEIRAVKFTQGPKPEDFKDFELNPGHSKKYRGNHRSHVRGVGIFAFFRNKWMKNIR